MENSNAVKALKAAFFCFLLLGGLLAGGIAGSMQEEWFTPAFKIYYMALGVYIVARGLKYLREHAEEVEDLFWSAVRALLFGGLLLSAVYTAVWGSRVPTWHQPGRLEQKLVAAGLGTDRPATREELVRELEKSFPYENFSMRGLCVSALAEKIQSPDPLDTQGDLNQEQFDALLGETRLLRKACDNTSDAERRTEEAGFKERMTLDSSVVGRFFVLQWSLSFLAILMNVMASQVRPWARGIFSIASGGWIVMTGALFLKVLSLGPEARTTALDLVKVGAAWFFFMQLIQGSVQFVGPILQGIQVRPGSTPWWIRISISLALNGLTSGLLWMLIQFNILTEVASSSGLALTDVVLVFLLAQLLGQQLPTIALRLWEAIVDF